MSLALKNLITMAASISIGVHCCISNSKLHRRPSHADHVKLFCLKFKVDEDIPNEEQEEDEEVISCVVYEAVTQIGPTD